MRISNAFASPNFAAELIPVEFVVLHYTAADLATTLAIFGDVTRGVCAHFVIDVDGTVHDLGGFLDGPIRRGAHAGESRLEVDGRTYTAFNQFSIGIELINLNGNLFEYAGAQYEGLRALLTHLVGRFPALGGPGRVVGHEHIAGVRGKCDPGRAFDWSRALEGTGAERHPLQDRRACTDEDLVFITSLVANTPSPSADFWPRLSTELEARVRERGRSSR